MASFCAACGSELPPGAKFCASCGTAVTARCVGCSNELPAGASFCPSCGASQDGVPTPERGSEELRVVTCLFADLAGFTSHTERSDPEDVRARLATYHREVRADVERWGGHIEKLMGDGVFAVFGVPTVSEDDPERAVRAALRIQQSVENLDKEDHELSVRIGITTGEAIVQLDEADQNERIVGDVVNTASRLEGVAPPGGVVIDERTYQAVRNVIECEPLDPVQVKGKAGRLSVWLAREARSRYGVAVAEEEAAEFVGREEELSLLNDALDRAVARRAPQLVTISGEAGVGKSRLGREFRARLDDRADLVVRWRQGRSLPYGEGVTFWALSEIVKSEAGILESEPPDEARAKLNRSLDALAEDVDGLDRDWLRQRLGPLVGIGGAEGVDRSELFSAWLQYVELLSARHPLVMLMEDLHWADDALADFLEHVVDWGEDAPVLIVCTARPDWFIRRPHWGGGKREAATIGLSPLSAEETSRLVASLSHRAVMPAEAQQALLEQSGGNPLYLTEYVRLAEEKGWFESGAAPEDLPLPGSVQAVIASRLDLLDGPDKALLQAAAVIGRVFWGGALTFLRDQDAHEVKDALLRLARRDVLRPVRRSSMQGQDEYIFTHVLARDVAYGQLTRSERARLHREAARWLEAVSGERAIDVAELLAHHHVRALELEPSEDRELLDRVYRFLMLAEERTASLDMAAAARFAGQAADLAADPIDRARALLALGKSQEQTREETLAAISAAIDLFAEGGDRFGQAEALDLRSGVEWWAGNRAASDRDRVAALALIENQPPNQVTARILAGHAAMLQLGGHEEEALEVVERALAAAAAAGDVNAHAKALRIRGSALTQIGDLSGEDDVLEALRIDLDRGNTREVMSGYNNHATLLGVLGQAHEARDVIDEAIAYGAQRGASGSVEWSKMTKCEALIQLGDLDGVEALADELIEADAARGGTQVGHFARGWKCTVLWARGNPEESWEIGKDLLPRSREIGDPQALMPSLAQSILIADSAGEIGFAESLLPEFDETGRANPVFLTSHLWPVAPIMLKLGQIDQLEQLVDLAEAGSDPWLQATLGALRALVLEARGRHEEALELLDAAIELGDSLDLVFHTTRLRIDAARCAYALDRTRLGDDLIATTRRHATQMGMGIALKMIDDVADGTAAAG